MDKTVWIEVQYTSSQWSVEVDWPALLKDWYDSQPEDLTDPKEFAKFAEDWFEQGAYEDAIRLSYGHPTVESVYIDPPDITQQELAEYFDLPAPHVCKDQISFELTT